MEINTEVNKIFGQEMAKLFAATINEDEMMRHAKNVWIDLNSDTDHWGNRKNTELHDLIKQVLIENLQNKITEILKEPINEKETERKARELIKKAEEIAEEATVKALASHMVDERLNCWNSYDKFTQDVLNILHTEEENKRSRSW